MICIMYYHIRHIDIILCVYIYMYTSVLHMLRMLHVCV